VVFRLVQRHYTENSSKNKGDICQWIQNTENVLYISVLFPTDISVSAPKALGISISELARLLFSLPFSPFSSPSTTSLYHFQLLIISSSCLNFIFFCPRLSLSSLSSRLQPLDGPFYFESVPPVFSSFMSYCR
jgi:hypothetical protein